MKTTKILIKKWGKSKGPVDDIKKYEVYWCMRNLSKDMAAQLKSLLQREMLQSYMQVATTVLLLP